MQLDTLIIRFLENKITSHELSTLYNLLQYKENEEYFKRYIQLNHKVYLTLHDTNLEEAYLRVNKKMQKSEKRFRIPALKNKRIIAIYTIAAIFVLLIGISKFIELKNPVNPPTILSLTDLPVTIVLGNGKSVALNNKDTLIQVGSNILANQNGRNTQLSYLHNSNEIKGDIPFNIIKVPFGKKYTLILADSTVVYLNSGASMRFPVSFANAKNRVVSVSGEAYFEVAKDKNHPFIVNSKTIEVKVLGTSFNFSSYADSNISEVVLVEGSVNMKAKENAKFKILKPGFKGSYNTSEGNIDIEEVNTELYTSWVYGKLVFRDKTISQILQSLERNFNVRIINENKSLKEEKLNTTFNKDESLERILFYLKKAYKIEYVINENEILIK